jgi:hypothetical protein
MRFLFFIFFVTTGALAQSIGSFTSSTASLSTSTMEKLRESYKISYFSEVLGPSIKKWDDNEINERGEKQGTPMMMYHSFNVRYLLTQTFNLFMNPRVSTVIGDRNDLRETDDQNVLVMDDWQFGVFNTFYKSKTFQYNQRLTHRHPFSRASQNSGIDSQIEWQHDLTWMPTSALRIIHWNNYRYYAYENEVNEERYRINFTTLLNYTLNDNWNVQYMHELDLQHRNPKEGPDQKDANFFKRYKHYNNVGIGYSPVPNLTFIPFLRMMDERNIRNETMMVGLWILGRVL